MILALVNQVDRLLPNEEWNPPGNIGMPVLPKGSIIKEVLQYNQELLNPDSILPLCVGDKLTVDKIAEYLQHAYENGVNTQLNRRRDEHDINRFAYP